MQIGRSGPQARLQWGGIVARECPAETEIYSGRQRSAAAAKCAFSRPRKTLRSFPALKLPLCLLLAALLLAPGLAKAHFLPPRSENIEAQKRAEERGIPVPTELEVFDRPNDDGSSVLLSFEVPTADEDTAVMAQASVDKVWQDCAEKPVLLSELPRHIDEPRYYSGEELSPEHAQQYSLTVDSVMLPGEDGALALQPLETGRTYSFRLMLYKNGGDPAAGRIAFLAGDAAPLEQWFNTAFLNQVLMALVFTMIMMGAIFAARQNPNLFIRRIAGLEAVDEAIGRATEMGRPVMQVNGLDPLTSASTVAAVNILGRIARRIASYDSTLMVPCVDPVVMTVSQETVKQAYAEAGRPDAYRSDSVFFVTDQQFSYVASVCGFMMRDRPAAIVYLGAFYAESLLLAETGAGTGAIQIAGTDSQHQLPFFVVSCDYTLIGEELYAASAYLSREPMLLGSLKGLDIAKAIVMLLILLGTIMATAGQDILTRWFTPL
ncbi:hypothetical protein IT575_03195 [bacterium]|nr:hypothetical protein [bacterium]